MLGDRGGEFVRVRMFESKEANLWIQSSVLYVDGMNGGPKQKFKGGA